MEHPRYTDFRIQTISIITRLQCNKKKLNIEGKHIIDALKCCFTLYKFQPTCMVQEELKLKCPTTSPVSGTSVQSVNFSVALLILNERLGEKNNNNNKKNKTKKKKQIH